MLGADTKFREAASKGDLAQVKALYLKEILNNAGETSGKTALHRAAQAGHLDVVKWLIDQKAKCDIQDNDGNTPIQLATIFEKYSVVNFLLSKNVKIMHKNKQGKQLLNLLLQCTDSPQRNAIYQQIKNKILEELIYKKQLGEDIQGIEFKENGDIILHDREKINKDKENLILTNKSFTAINFSTGEKTKYKEYGQYIKVDNTAFELPPLVFLANHDDEQLLKFISQIAPFLNCIGYKALCFEYDQNLSLQKTIKSLEENAKKSLNGSVCAKLNELNANLLKQIHEKTTLDYIGIDQNLGIMRDWSIWDSDMSKWVDIIHESRRVTLSQNMFNAAKKYNGGIIVLIGIGHYKIRRMMQEDIGTVESQFVHCYHLKSNYSNHDDYVNQYLMSEILGENHIKLSLDEQTISQTLSLLKQSIRKHRSNHVQDIKESSYDTFTNSSSILTHFNKMIDENSEKFIGAYNTSDYTVDALFAVKNEHHFEEIAEKIQERFNVPSTLIFSKISNDAKKLSLCVSGINAEPNSGRIYKALLRSK